MSATPHPSGIDLGRTLSALADRTRRGIVDLLAISRGVPGEYPWYFEYSSTIQAMT